ncbi:hypothetical protein RchiOBHm_Chr3g0458771 [Rosa chinensis]|uniref:Uncharacterized protein n=1 Tax=Rosa chinensis TaxID=74649 RepID=A0A2P6R816_ROSCH|nr:hypothetical protein RchiOBHm_Chr3g0458771 [Rosa chinensis]
MFLSSGVERVGIRWITRTSSRSDDLLREQTAIISAFMTTFIYTLMMTIITALITVNNCVFTMVIHCVFMMVIHCALIIVIIVRSYCCNNRRIHD